MSSKRAGIKRRRQHSAELKARVALEAIQERRTTNEIAAEYGVHPTQVSAWKRQAVENLSVFFDGDVRVDGNALKRQESELFEQIIRLKMELEWLKKSMELCARNTGCCVHHRVVHTACRYSVCTSGRSAAIPVHQGEEINEASD
jgi:transposase